MHARVADGIFKESRVGDMKENVFLTFIGDLCLLLTHSFVEYTVGTRVSVIHKYGCLFYS